KTFTESFNERYGAVKKRYKDSFHEMVSNTQVRAKAIASINDKSNSGSLDLGRRIDELLTEIALDGNAKDLLRKQYSKVESHYANVRFYTKEQILSKAIALRGN